MKYKFYIKMDGTTFGPYSADEVLKLNLTDDVLVTEEDFGSWLPASRFDFVDMAQKEAMSKPENFRINEDGTITRSVHPIPETRPVPSNDIHEKIKGWNWGAFFFNWLWGVCNGVYWPLVLILVNLIPYVGILISFGACIALGIHGNEWAWKAKSWRSVAEFKRVQHKWSIAILWVLGISIGLGLICGIIAGMAGY